MSRFLSSLLRQLPKDTRAEVKELFALGRLAGETKKDVAVFLYMVRECIQEWRARTP